jgi:hypothetical protein
MRNERVNQADQKHFLLTIFSEVSLLLQTAVNKSKKKNVDKSKL